MLLSDLQTYEALSRETVGEAKWTDPAWQQRKSIKSLATLHKINAQFQSSGQESEKHFQIQITPYYLSLIDLTNPKDPLSQIVIPSSQEMTWHSEELVDPIGDLTHSPTENLIHRYPDRCLLLLTQLCSSYCRYCFRRETVGKKEKFDSESFQKSLTYIRNTPQLREIIFSGGDPLSLHDHKIENILYEIKKISHIRTLRFHTRYPVFNPYRITDSFVKILGTTTTQSIWFVVHVIHPNEITEDFKKSMKKLQHAGIPLLNQSVLIRHVNDNLETLKELSYRLAECGIKPYYLHSMDLARGTAHFRVPILKARQLIKELRGQISGFLIPELILDLPRGHGKIRLEESFVKELSEKEGKVSLKIESVHTQEYSQNNTYKKMIDYQEI